MKCGIKITYVSDESKLSQYGVREGWRILSINNHLINDALDYMFYSSAIRLSLELANSKGNVQKICYYKKFWDEEIGIEVEQIRIRRCGNKCIFCFVDQLAPNLRQQLYIKDEDYRYSFLNGNFITGTNLRQSDLERIARLRLSPLYFSVHSTDTKIRREMIRYPRGGLDILAIFAFLKKHKIEFHTQIVLCPGINDGESLKKTITDLFVFYPGLQSIAIVPLGLTKHRKGLPKLQHINKEYAKKFIKEIKKVQKELYSKISQNILFLSDEFYYIAGENPPMYKNEEYVPQLENGVGMVREFYTDWKNAVKKIPSQIQKPLKVGIITGEMGKRVLKKVVDVLRTVKNLKIDTIAAENNLFGESVTVSGLLSGNDILNTIYEVKEEYDLFLIPENALRENDLVFLDDVRLDEIREKVNKPIIAVGNSVVDLVTAIFMNYGLL